MFLPAVAVVICLRRKDGAKKLLIKRGKAGKESVCQNAKAMNIRRRRRRRGSGRKKRRGSNGDGERAGKGIERENDEDIISSKAEEEMSIIWQWRNGKLSANGTRRINGVLFSISY